VEQHQKELEIEFESRFPALYKKAKAMRPAAAFDDTPSPPPGSPPPPFEPRKSQSFKDVDWEGHGKEDDDYFDLRKGPLVGPLASGLDKMREAGNISLPRSDSGTSFTGYHDDYPVKARMNYYVDEYEHDYDEIDPKSEGLGNEPGFQKAGMPAASDAGSGAGTGAKGHERGAEDTLKKATKKRPQIWERLRSGGK
jgi:hypothetical protein